VRSLRDGAAGLCPGRLSSRVILLCVLACPLPGFARQNDSPAIPAKPSVQVDLAPAEYMGLSRGARLSGTANVSLNFLDAQHILLTFNPKKLFTRQPDCPPSHDDRLLHVAVLEVPSGKVVKQADWYLHDARRYLWELGPGRILLRRLNRLYEVNADLEEKLVLDSPQELLWVSVTPGGKQIITETRVSAASNDNRSRDKVRARITFLDSKSMTVQRVIESQGTINLQATESGFTDVRNYGGVWLVRFGPAVRDRVNITRVKARRPPNILYSSANTILVGRCSLAGNDYIVSAFTVTGTHLWKQRWSECRYTPAVTASGDGSRFAASSLTVLSEAVSAGGNGPEQDGLQQTVQVFDTASGGSVLSAGVSPPVLDGVNYALSPDGGQLAVLQATTLDIYSLPEMSADERTKYLAVKNDTSGLYVPPSRTNRDSAPETIEISAADDSGGPEPARPASTGPPAPGDLAKTSVSPLPSPPSAGTPSASAAAASAMPRAEGSTNPDPPTLTFRTGTQVVALDVVVTDSRGHVVKGLQQSDFSIGEDGKPQLLRHFREYSPGQAPPPPPPQAQAEAAKLPPNIFSNYTQPSEPGSVTVVLLDLLNTPMADQSYAQAQLIKFLKTKPQDAQFALCTLSNKLQMIQGFTRDEHILLASAHSKKASFRNKSLLDSDAAPISMEAGQATAKFLPNLDFFVEAIELQQSEARVLDADRRMMVTVDAFAQLARYLSGIPGRKNLVWLSGSFTLGISPDTSGQDPFIQARNYSENVKRVSNLFAEAHVAVYPVDVRGLVTDPLFSASSNDTLAPLSMQESTPTGPAGGGGGDEFPRAKRNASTAVPIAAMQASANQFGLSQMGEHATMDKLAAETGGRAFYNTNGIAKAIDAANQEGANYYALSYTPANKNYDGSFRKVKVTLAGKKYHLAYRGGYYAVDPHAMAKPEKDLASSLAMAAMQQGSPQSRQIVFGAKVIPLGQPRMMRDAPALSAKSSKKKRKGETAPVEMQLYSIDYAVTPADLRFNAMPDGTYHDVINFMATAFDEEGALVASQISQISADLKPETFRDIQLGGVRVHQEIDVPAKSVALRLGVEDVADSHIGTLEIPLPVKAPPDAPAVARRSMPPVERD
jgi:VWFA-related protein